MRAPFENARQFGDNQHVGSQHSACWHLHSAAARLRFCRAKIAGRDSRWLISCFILFFRLLICLLEYRLWQCFYACLDPALIGCCVYFPSHTDVACFPAVRSTGSFAILKCCLPGRGPEEIHRIACPCCHFPLVMRKYAEARCCAPANHTHTKAGSLAGWRACLPALNTGVLRRPRQSRRDSPC